MIDCTQYRRSQLAAPQEMPVDVRAHGEQCPECTEFTRRLLGFEARLARAVRLTAEAAPIRRSRQGRPLRHLRGDRGWLALAASMLLGVGFAAVLWLAAPRPTLAEALVAHMAGEPQAWRRTDVPVPEPRLSGVLRDAHVQLSSRAGLVTYANSCRFRGHRVPHFVVQSDRGPVTVMVLVHESVRAAVHFDEQGYRGVIVPVPGHGAIAVLTHGGADDAKTVAQIAERLVNAIVWTA